jgi:ubiquinone/menaquinone biosynthesis C-methylase UbiE
MMNEITCLMQREKGRLRLQARVWEHEAEEMLNYIDVKPGWFCVDLGCGAMGLLAPLSRRVGENGQVFGVDFDPLLLDSAKDYIKVEKLSNVILMQRDIAISGMPTNYFDLVHTRFVLTLTNNPEPIVSEMYNLIKPDGIAAIQEPDHNSLNYYPCNPSWPRLKEILNSAISLHGDPNVGQKVYGFMLGAGFTNINVRAATMSLRNKHPYMYMPINAVNTLRETIIDNKISTQMELDDLLGDLTQTIEKPETLYITFTTIQVWGSKPGEDVL